VWEGMGGKSEKSPLGRREGKESRRKEGKKGGW
jgi:hypothetical protein